MWRSVSQRRSPAEIACALIDLSINGRAIDGEEARCLWVRAIVGGLRLADKPVKSE
jgi:hypothetical protein